MLVYDDNKRTVRYNGKFIGKWSEVSDKCYRLRMNWDGDTSPDQYFESYDSMKSWIEDDWMRRRDVMDMLKIYKVKHG